MTTCGHTVTQWVDVTEGNAVSTPTVEVLVQIEGVELRTMAAMRIYARYFPVTCLAFFMSAFI